MTEFHSEPDQYVVSITEHHLNLAPAPLPYRAIAGWQPLFEDEKPVARIFHVAYLVSNGEASPRPITFIFNGGPGAASVYLHMGALGPHRIRFEPDGKLPRSPVQLQDNQDSWLRFSDLVFVDPVGTGFSRALPQGSEGKGSEAKTPQDPAHASTAQDQTMTKDPTPKEQPFWSVDKDLKVLGEFIQHFLSRHHRWLSPVYVAGESYGGFRVAKLARLLPQEFGIGLTGAILISPALEFSLLYGDDYTLSFWATLIPAYAATAAYHGRVQWAGAPGDRAAHLQTAEHFALSTLIPVLAMGESMPAAQRDAAYDQLAGLIGLPRDLVHQHRGRIPREVFTRELLRDQRRVVGLYDGSLTAVDPFPDRLQYEGLDPTLHGSEAVFTAAINHHLRFTLQVNTDLTYRLLDFAIFKAWVFNLDPEIRQGFVGAVDDLRVGMTLNPHLKVHLVHGIYDLITTYFASNHLINQMHLDPELRPNLEVSQLEGGHMFYTWDRSRIQWFSQMQAFYGSVVGS